MGLMEWGNGIDVGQFEASRAVSMILLWLMAAIAVFMVLFAFLMMRQAYRMAHVLPTPITSVVKLAVWVYLLLTIVVVGIIVNFLV